MFDRRTFAQMRQGGMGVHVSKGKLTQAMTEILLQLPAGTTDLKETIVRHLGFLGQMTATRDINSAWNDAKKRAVREYPDRFLMGSRGVLLWNDGSVRVLDKTVSAASFRKLNNLAKTEGCSVDHLIGRLIAHYRKRDS
jgi:hypothetical protein